MSNFESEPGFQPHKFPEQESGIDEATEALLKEIRLHYTPPGWEPDPVISEMFSMGHFYEATQLLLGSIDPRDLAEGTLSRTQAEKEDFLRIIESLGPESNGDAE